MNEVKIATDYQPFHEFRELKAKAEKLSRIATFLYLILDEVPQEVIEEAITNLKLGQDQISLQEVIEYIEKEVLPT